MTTPEKSTALAPVRPQVPALPSKDELEKVRALATVIYNSGQFPKAIQNIETAMMIGLYGKEIGYGFLQSLTAIHMIEGVPSIHYKDQLALIRRDCPGATIEFLQQDEKACRILAQRPGQKPQEFKWTHEEALRAGYLKWDEKLKCFTGKDNWVNSETDMLTARCVSRMNRAMFSDVSRGFCYTPEEIVESREVKDADTGATVSREKSADTIPRKSRDAKSEVEEAQLSDEAEIIITAEEPKAEPAPESAEDPSKNSDREKIIALVGALNETDDLQMVESCYQFFVDSNKGNVDLIMQAYEILEQRKKNLEVRTSEIS